MFWTITLIIYLVITISNWIFTVTTAVVAIKKFETLYPDHKTQKISSAEFMQAILKQSLINALPIIHLFMLFTYLFYSDKIVSVAIEKAKGE